MIDVIEVFNGFGYAGDEEIDLLELKMSIRDFSRGDLID
jgi:hypothetical protein